MKRMVCVFAMLVLCFSGCTNVLTVTTSVSDAAINVFPSATLDTVRVVLEQPQQGNYQTTPATFQLKTGQQYDIVVTHPDCFVAAESIVVNQNQSIHIDLKPRP